MKRQDILCRVLRMAALALALVAGTMVHAQSEVIMVNQDTILVDACRWSTGTLYDDGGTDGNYANSFRGVVVIEAVPGMTLSLTGSYDLESCCDHVRVSDGVQQIGESDQNQGILTVSSTTGRLVVSFESDGSVVSTGFALTWSVTSAASCVNAVSALAVSNITGTSATLQWTADNAAGPFLVMLDGRQVATVTSTSYQLTSLSPSRRYEVTVVASASSSNRCCGDVTAFRTACGTASHPFSEGFEGLEEGEVAPCWVSLTNFDDVDAIPQVVSMPVCSGSRSHMLSCGSNDVAGHFGMLMAPPMLADGSEFALTLRPSHWGTVVVVGTCSETGSVYDRYNFQALDTLTLYSTDSWEYHRLTLPTGGGLRRPALLMEQSMQGGTGRRVYLDDAGVAVCGVSSMHITEVTYQSITVEWETFGSPSVTVGIRPLSAAVDQMTYANVTSPLTIGGLESTTDYEVTLYPICDNNQALPFSSTARTLAPPVSAEGWCQSFYAISSTEDMTVYSSNNSHYLWYEDNALTLETGSPTDTFYFVTPELLNIAGKQVVVTYRTGHGEANMQIGTMMGARDRGSFVAFDSVSTEPSDYRCVVRFTVPANASGQRLALRYYRHNDDPWTSLRWWIYDMQSASCLLDSVHIRHVRGTQVELAWKAPSPDTVIVEYGPRNFEFGSGLRDTVVGATSHTVRGLTNRTAYDFVVYCGSVATPCGGVRHHCVTQYADHPMPYCEDFSTIDRWSWDEWGSNDWARVNELNGCPAFSEQVYYPAAGISLEMTSYGFDWGYYAQASMPDVMIEGGEWLSFYASSFAPNGYLVVGTVDWTHAYYTFQPLDTIELRGDGSRHRYLLHLRSSDTLLHHRLSLRYQHRNEYSLYRCYIDELHIARTTYDSVQTVYVGFDSLAYEVHGVGAPDSLLVVLGDGNVYLDSVLLPGIGGVASFGGLDSGHTYYVYVQPLDSVPECLSYATYSHTHSVGGFGYGSCFNFDDLLSYELPDGWTFAGGAAEAVDDALQLEPHVVATMPVGALQGRTFSSRVRSSVPGDTVHFTLCDTSYTYIADTVWSYFATVIPDVADSCLMQIGAGAGTLLIDNTGFSNCPLLSFTVEGSTIICSTGNGQAGYMITAVDNQSGDMRTYQVSTNPFRISDLALGRSYDISWQCLNNASDCLPTVTVTTGTTLALPYCVDFTSSDQTISYPPLWEFVFDSNNYTLSFDMWGPSIRYGNYWAPWHYILLPVLPAESAMSLYLSAYTWDEGGIEVGTVNAAGDTATFQSITSFNPYDIREYVDISSGAGRRLALRVKAECRIFSLAIHPTPKTEFQLLSATDLLIHSQPAGDYYMRMSHGYADTVLHITTDSLVVTVPDNINDINFTPYADSTGIGCFPARNAQLSDRVNLPFCLDYWWDWYTKGLSVKPWRSNPGGTYEDDNYIWFFDLTRIPDQYQVLRLPEMNVDSLSQVSLSFVIRSPWVGDTLEVGVMTDAYDVNTFVPVASVVYTATDDSWQRQSVALSAYQGAGRWLAMRHQGMRCPDGMEWQRMYVDSLRVEACPYTAGATATLYRHNIVKIDNPNVSGNADFYLEYGIHGFSQGDGTTVHVTTLPHYITLQTERTYDFYFHCSADGTSCSAPQIVTTLAVPLDIPACIDFDSVQVGEMPDSWSASGGVSVSGDQSHSAGKSLRIPVSNRSYAISPDVAVDSLANVVVSFWFRADNASDRLMVGTVSSPTDPRAFHPLRTYVANTPGVWQQCFLEFSSAPSTDHFISFRTRSANNGAGTSIYIDDLHVSSCGAINVRVTNVSNSSITLVWDQVGQPDINIIVEEEGALPYPVAATQPPVTISPLSPWHHYTFHFSSQCSGGSSSCGITYSDSITIVTPSENASCVNTTDLYSSQALFFYGTCNNPYAQSGAINYGANHLDSRHTVVYDTSQRDPRTGGLLRMVPEGATSSVRLGNWGTNALAPEAEGVTYSLFVDTMSFQLLILRYAAVLQDPMHAPADQPRFRMELLDQNYNLIDSACTSADFVANRNLGWNEADDNVLWKDWTSVGIDLSAYANTTVYLRLTTFDCNEGSHYGYAYFTLDCFRKTLETARCGNTDDNTFTAPSGFAYRWYSSLSPQTISTAQTITVPTAEVTYHCDLSFVDNPDCQFTISAYAGTRFPLAAFNYTMYIDSCRFYVTFNNQSTVSADGVTPIGTGEPCETAWWDFGNGTTSNSYHGSAVYILPGTYTVTLVSGIADGECTDTVTQTLTLVLPNSLLKVDTTDASICQGESYLFRGDTYTQTGNYTQSVSIENTCDSIYLLRLTVNPTTSSDTLVEACDTFNWRDSNYVNTGIYQALANQSNQYGCDSTVYLHLTVYHSEQTVVNAEVVENDLPYYFAETMLTPTDSLTTYTFDRTTTHGCDSTVTLHLTYWHNVVRTVDTAICRDRLPVEFADTLLAPEEAFASFTFHRTTNHGADSTVVLNLTVIDNPLGELYDTIVENSLPYRYRGQSLTTAQEDTMFVFSYHRANACDSLFHLHIHVWRNVATTVDSAICATDLPLSFADTTLNPGVGDTTYLIVLATSHGADSVVTLNLMVHPVYSVTDTIVICPGRSYYYASADTLLHYTGHYTDFHFRLPSIHGCDSLVALTLALRDSTFRPSLLNSFDGEHWAKDSVVVLCAPDRLYLLDTTPDVVERSLTITLNDSLVSTTDTLLWTDIATVTAPAYATLVVANNGGCIDTLVKPIITFPRPVAEFEWLPFNPPMHNPEATFNSLSQPDTLTCRWLFQALQGQTYDTSDLCTTTYHWGGGNEDMRGDYSVRLVSYWHHVLDTLLVSPFTPWSLYVEQVCTDTAEHTVTIINSFLQFPNLVTPNGDGINDRWEVVGLLESGIYSMNELWIFNHWGEQVYHVRDISRPEQFWDPNATNSPDGTYYYRFSAKSENDLVKRNGIIEVLRR